MASAAEGVQGRVRKQFPVLMYCQTQVLKKGGHDEWLLLQRLAHFAQIQVKFSLVLCLCD